MPLQIPEDFGMISFHHSSPDYQGEAIFTLGIDVVDHEPTEADAEAIYELWRPAINGVYSTRVTFTGVRILYTQGGALKAVEYLENDAGPSSAEAVTPSVAWLVNKKTAFVGKKHRGRMYLPGSLQGHLSEPALWSSSVRITMNGYIDDLYNGLVAIPYPPVILHNDATNPTPITQMVVSSRPATQRGRLRN